jgi:hypothetical protein
MREEVREKKKKGIAGAERKRSKIINRARNFVTKILIRRDSTCSIKSNLYPSGNHRFINVTS